MPEVMELNNPKGFPMAAIFSPTFRLDESPMGNGCSKTKSALTLIIAMSVNSSDPITSALYCRPSRNVTTTFVASFITCAFVMMCPILSKTKPDPTPPTASSVSFFCTLTLTTPGSDFSKISINDKSFE